MQFPRSLVVLAVAAIARRCRPRNSPARHCQQRPRRPDPKTAAATLRVSAIRGFVYPWALAFLPNGDMLVTEQGKNTLRVVRGGVLDPTPVAGLPQGITSTRRDTAGVDIAIQPRFAENRYLYVAYWKPSPGSDAAAKGANIRTAVLIRARYDGSPTLSDVREIFASASWTDGPSAARLVFGRDGKIYLAMARRASPPSAAPPFGRSRRLSTAARSCG